ncbi:YceI family protein [Parashewanella curva]|uniref:YceI family protein n=1 Tax=Parashewanella curva TaxID=2338552 RepID=UPI0026973A6C
MKKTVLMAALFAAMTGSVNAADYKVDIEGAHAFVNFKIKHLGYSWLYGRFNTFDGKFNWDAYSSQSGSVIPAQVDHLFQL